MRFFKEKYNLCKRKTGSIFNRVIYNKEYKSPESGIK